MAHAAAVAVDIEEIDDVRYNPVAASPAVPPAAGTATEAAAISARPDHVPALDSTHAALKTWLMVRTSYLASPNRSSAATVVVGAVSAAVEDDEAQVVYVQRRVVVVVVGWLLEG